MNTSIGRPRFGHSLAKGNLPKPSHDVGQLIALGRAHYWPFHLLGRAPIVREPVRLGDWLLVPAEQDSTVLPHRSMSRIRAIFAAGIRPQGFVLVHEAPKLLKAPVAPPVKTRALPEAMPLPHSTPDFATAVESGFSVLASLIGPLLYLFVAAAFVDPILVAVTEDGYWIEIDRWNME